MTNTKAIFELTSGGNHRFDANVGVAVGNDSDPSDRDLLRVSNAFRFPANLKPPAAH